MGKIYFNANDLGDKYYDFVVVGAGNAGGVIAARLAENPHFKVLVIEAGLSDTEPESDVLRTPFLAGLAVGTKFDWDYKTTPQAGLNGREIPFPRGYVVGGSSNTNSLVYLRGPSEDFDRLANISGDQGWSWTSLQKYIKMNERHVRPWNNRNDENDYNPAVHGDGPLQTTLVAEPTDLDQRVIKAANELQGQFRYNLDLNSGDGLGVGWIHTTVGGGARSSSSTAFLKPAIESRENIDLLVHYHVTRLLPAEGGSLDFRTVELAQDASSQRIILTAKKEVILCAGAIGTPQILQLSGIGPKAVLDRAGIAQLVDAPDVGRHLQDQPIIFYQWRVNSTTLSSFFRDPANVGASMAEYAASKTGFAAGVAFFSTIAFLRLPDHSPIIKAEHKDPAAGPNSSHYLYSFLNSYAPNPGQEPGPTEGDWISIAAVLQSPTSGESFFACLGAAADTMAEGSVEIQSSSAFDHPAINPAYLSTAFDLNTMITTFKTTAEFFSAPIWTGYIAEPDPEITGLTTDAAIEAYVRKYSTTVKHPVATARISKAGAIDGVVGPDLCVKKITGVRVVDASVLPFASAGFPQAQIYILAERAAALIKEKWSN
ncbi:Aryl-alcohol oxidase-like protein [Mycena indigotica]|uniref:Aryl-alcohol oxidase-like protein n=1 Tax=Mycena indigotica TaxID=2126181 RepID=A0A8H6SI31_9AGAR|nr:Aryl-alcohol oxidase-like protein [Mycena indigotica]KAF7299257.1 Aryl-alcohol oxidase-like protein [Mycena indigotica]